MTTSVIPASRKESQEGVKSWMQNVQNPHWGLKWKNRLYVYVSFTLYAQTMEQPEWLWNLAGTLNQLTLMSNAIIWYWLWSILCSVLIWYAWVIVHLYLDYHSISHQCYCLFISMPQKHFIYFIKVVFFIQNVVTIWNVWYRYVVYFKQQQFQVLPILDYCKQKPQPKPVCF